MIKYPSTIGITGRATEKKSIIMSVRGKDDKYYNGEVDNIGISKKIRNMMAVPLLSPNNQVVGVLQLINKIGPLDDFDVVSEQIKLKGKG